jgi:phosphoserine phosphatase
MVPLRLIVFDLDGVLVDIESSWQLVHRAFGTDNEENFQRYLSGAIDYQEFMRSDIRLWGRPHITQIQSILDKAPIMATAPSVMIELKRRGYKTAIISSGISLLADRIKTTLGVDHSYANQLLVNEDGWLTGEGEENVGLVNKDVVLKKLKEEEGADSRQCIVLGDSQFDIPLFREAGLTIAFNAKDEVVKKAADLVIEGKDLRKTLPWLTGRDDLVKVASSVEYGTAAEAKAVVRSILPDNVNDRSDLQIRTWSEGRTVQIKVLCLDRLETVLATLDDLLACMQVAERALRAVNSE